MLVQNLLPLPTKTHPLLVFSSCHQTKLCIYNVHPLVALKQIHIRQLFYVAVVGELKALLNKKINENKTEIAVVLRYTALVI